MKFEEFKTVAITLKAAYPSFKAFDTSEGICTWYEMLKDLDYSVASEAVSACIRESPYPPAVSDIRAASRRLLVPDWSVEWQKLLKGAEPADLNAPSQYAIRTLTEEYVREMMNSVEKVAFCMKEFERLYQNYFKLTKKDRESLSCLEVWTGGSTGFIQMTPRLLETKDGRVLE